MCVNSIMYIFIHITCFFCILTSFSSPLPSLFHLHYSHFCSNVFFCPFYIIAFFCVLLYENNATKKTKLEMKNGVSLRGFVIEFLTRAHARACACAFVCVFCVRECLFFVPWRFFRFLHQYKKERKTVFFLY